MNSRVEILFENNVINNRVYNEVDIIYKELSSLTDRASEDTANMFWTHFAMAIQRVLESKSIDAIDESLSQEAINSKYYEKANKLYSELEGKINIKLSENEKLYIILHLCNLFNDIKERELGGIND